MILNMIHFNLSIKRVSFFTSRYVAVILKTHTNTIKANRNKIPLYGREMDEAKKRISQ